MKHLYFLIEYDFWAGPTGTWLKGSFGLTPPVLALLGHGIQSAFTYIIPALVATNLFYDFLKKRRDAEREENK